MTVDVGVDHPAEGAGVSFLCCEVTPLPLLFHTAHFGRKSLYAAHLLGYLQKLFQILLHERFVSSPIY